VNTPAIIELPIAYDFQGQSQTIYPSLVIANDELTLVDTGYPGFLGRIEEAITKNGYSLSHLQNVIITHYDDDHIGSLYDLKEKYPRVNIMASARESQSISGAVKSERLRQAEEQLQHMTGEQQEFGRWFIAHLKSLKHVPIDIEVSDGEWIFDGQCQVIATPGHTSGHISLYFPSIQSVITGDAAVHENGELAVANPHYCLDLAAAEQSLTRIKGFEAGTYYCYHGGKYAAVTNG
jgi:glyoxylase-like metal-dependent hydrolase (beta-lactamase superfamily II)